MTDDLVDRKVAAAFKAGVSVSELAIKHEIDDDAIENAIRRFFNTGNLLTEAEVREAWDSFEK